MHVCNCTFHCNVFDDWLYDDPMYHVPIYLVQWAIHESFLHKNLIFHICGSFLPQKFPAIRQLSMHMHMHCCIHEETTMHKQVARSVLNTTVCSHGSVSLARNAKVLHSVRSCLWVARVKKKRFLHTWHISCHSIYYQMCLTWVSVD